MGLLSNAFKKKSNEQFTRSKTYRKDYLKKHKGFFGIYCCAYCGRLCSKSTMQVDHIYPVNGVKEGELSNAGGRMFITIISMLHGPKALKDGVNADWNKTAACPTCNHNKTDSKGLWVVRGYFGKFLFPIMNFILYGSILYNGINALATGDKSRLYFWVILTLIVKIVLHFISEKVK